MTNIKYSKRFKLRNGERIDFCPECDYHITDTVNNSDSVYCPKCGQQIQLFKPALCPKDCDFLNENNLELGEEFTIVYENGSKVYKDNEAFFFKNTPTYTNDILISKKDENFCPTILLGLLTGLYYVKRNRGSPK